MKNNKDNVYDHTSNNFDGIIALMSPEDSWVAKWQRIGKLYDLDKLPTQHLIHRTFYTWNVCNIGVGYFASNNNTRYEKPWNSL